MLGVVRLEPGDVLVVNFDRPLDQAARACAMDQLHHIFPKHHCILTSEVTNFTVIRSADDSRLTN
jgi:hypothetical protein